MTAGEKIEYTYPETILRVEPVFKQKVQILWRAAQKSVHVPEEKQSTKGLEGETVKFGGKNQTLWTYDNSTKEQQLKTIEELKKFVTETIDSPVFAAKKLDKKYKVSKTFMESAWEKEYEGKNGTKKIKEVLKKFDCDFDPYVHTKVAIELADNKVINATEGDSVHPHNYKLMDWSLYQHAEFTHDVPFAYLDEIAHLHALEIAEEEEKFE